MLQHFVCNLYISSLSLVFMLLFLFCIVCVYVWWNYHLPGLVSFAYIEFSASPVIVYCTIVFGHRNWSRSVLTTIFSLFSFCSLNWSMLNNLLVYQYSSLLSVCVCLCVCVLFFMWLPNFYQCMQKKTHEKARKPENLKKRIVLCVRTW